MSMWCFSRWRRGLWRSYLPVAAVWLLALSALSFADDLPGPIAADVIRVVDGDTLRVRVTVWIDQELEVSVRIRGIDAPEVRASCGRERWMGRRAKAYLAAATSGGSVTLSNVSGGKYFGRVLADVRSFEGNDMARALMRNRLVAPYAARDRWDWC